MLGVSPVTLRRWADSGRLKTWVTPGGHRRFSPDALARLLPSERLRRPTLPAAGVTAARVARSYRRQLPRVTAGLPWVLDLTVEQRALLRERGRQLAEAVLAHLDAGEETDGERHLADASAAASDYGRLAAGMGLSMSQTVESFLRFRAPFRRELLTVTRRRGFDTDEATELIERAEEAMDRLLVATMKGHVEAGRPAGRQARPSAPCGA